MAIHISKSPEETRLLGEKLGAKAQPGGVIGLIGDLGAGKTQFARGVARGLGIEQGVHSPTFAIVHEYQHGRLPCFHLDLYRLDSAEQIIGAGLEEYLQPDRGITIVEWFDRWLEAELPRPEKGVLVTITNEGEGTRRISYENFGA